jgi:hypothetical protein
MRTKHERHTRFKHAKYLHREIPQTRAATRGLLAVCPDARLADKVILAVCELLNAVKLIPHDRFFMPPAKAPVNVSRQCGSKRRQHHPLPLHQYLLHSTPTALHPSGCAPGSGQHTLRADMRRTGLRRDAERLGRTYK